MKATSRPYETRVQVRSRGRLLQAPRILFSAADDRAALVEGLGAVRERYGAPRPGTELVSVEVLAADGRRVALLDGPRLAAELEPPVPGPATPARPAPGYDAPSL